MIKNLFKKYREIIMYLIMGAGTTVVNWGVYALAVSAISKSQTLFGEEAVLLISNIVAWTLAVVFAYVTNKIFVFESYSWKFFFVLKEFATFVMARLATGLLEIIGVPILVKIGLDQTVFGIKGMVSKILVSIIVVILNYILSKLLIFKNKQ